MGWYNFVPVNRNTIMIKKSTKVTTTATPVYDGGPAIYVSTMAGDQAGIINLHSSIKPFWEKIVPDKLQATQSDLFVFDHAKGQTLCKMSGGKTVHIGWINGKPEAKARFMELFGTEELRFSVPVSEDDMSDLI